MSLYENGVSISIVSYNSAPFIKQCLLSIYSQTLQPSRVIVVDNASVDRTREIIGAEFPTVSLIHNETNLGYSGGHNLGIKEGRTQAVLCLNPDVWLMPDFLERLMQSLLAHPKAAMATGMLYRTERIDHESLAAASEIKEIDSAGLELSFSYRARERGQGLNDFGQFEGCELFGACGAAVLLRRDALEAVAYRGEYFDEILFGYKEDIDLSWRIQKAGWYCWFEPTAVGYHVRGWRTKSRNRIVHDTRVRSLRNQYLLLAKNVPLRPFTRLVAAFLHEIALVAYFTFREPFLWKAVGEAAALVPEMMSRRRHYAATGPVGS